MLQYYDAMVPAGVTIVAARRLAGFIVRAGALTLTKFSVPVAIAGAVATFDVRKNGVTIYATTGDRPSIAVGQRSVTQDTLAVATADGDLIEIYLTAWPTAGLVGPVLLEVGVDDGVVFGTDVPLDKEMLVTGYYKGAFGRDPTGSELATNLAALDSACIASTFLAQVLARIEALVDDGEFGSPSNTVFVQRVYRMYFGREPDAGGQSFWEGELTGGTTRDTMRADFANHPEFVNRVALYCRAQLPTADARLILGQTPAAYVASIVTGAVVTGIDTVIYSTASLADGATENVSLSMGGIFWRVTRIEANFAARVRAYFRNAQRTADAARLFETEPTGEHGVIFDMQLLTNLDFDMSPPADGANYDDLTSPDAWVAITNLSGATRPIQVILHRRLL